MQFNVTAPSAGDSTVHMVTLVSSDFNMSTATTRMQMCHTHDEHQQNDCSKAPAGREVFSTCDMTYEVYHEPHFQLILQRPHTPIQEPANSNA